jgi:hypothetical protein
LRGRKRHGDNALARHLGAIGNCRPNIVDSKLRISGQDLFGRLAARKEIENQGNPDARALDARLAEADVGVDGDAVEGEGIGSR